MARQYKSLYGNQNEATIRQNTSDLWMLKFGTDVQKRLLSEGEARQDGFSDYFCQGVA